MKGECPTLPQPNTVVLEDKYSPIEKIYLELILVIQKIRHYFQHHYTRLISKEDPLKYILNRPTLNGRLAKWAVLFQQYDIEYVPQKETKGQALMDFMTAHLVSDNSPLAQTAQTKRFG